MVGRMCGHFWVSVASLVVISVGVDGILLAEIAELVVPPRELLPPVVVLSDVLHFAIIRVCVLNGCGLTASFGAYE